MNRAKVIFHTTGLTAGEREIDQRVYCFYPPAAGRWQAGGLTPAEIKIVEEGRRERMKVEEVRLIEEAGKK